MKKIFEDFPANPLENSIENLKKIIDENLKEINNLLTINNKTYKNFVKPFVELSYKLDLFFTPIYHIHSVKNSKESQKVYEEAIPLLSNYSSEVSQNLEIFKAFKEVSNTKLSPAEKKVVEDYLLDFKLSGAELEQQKKDRLKEINLKLSELSNKFSQNVLDDTDKFKLIIDNPDFVTEIPKSDLANAEFTDENGQKKWKFTLQLPSYLSYMTYGNNREIREKLYKAYTTRGGDENGKIIDEILKLKYEKAKLLGFNNFAELSLATKMAESCDEVLNFLQNLADKSKNVAKKELAEIKDFSKLEDFNSFDVAYYSEKYRKKYYSIDEEEYRPYFEQSRVVKGVLDFISEKFNIKFEKQDLKLWDSKVQTFDLIENNKPFARLYLDLEARDGKKSGAWMNDWHSHHINSKNIEELPTAFVVCNFPKSSEKTKSFLRHDDITTLMHEMGHAIHHLFSKVSEIDISGTNGVEWDAVEFPSQFLENFSFDRNFLKSFAKHDLTGEQLPDEMIDKLIKARNFQSAMQMVRQLEFGLFDFKLHSELYQADEVQKLLDEIRKEISPLLPPKYNKFQNSFTHIFAGGYAAGYYSYKWAEVLSADLYFEVLENSDLWQKYQTTVLQNGAIKSMSELFQELLSRKPDPSKLLKLSGIKN